MNEVIKSKQLTIEDLHRLMNFDSKLKSQETVKNYLYVLKKFEREFLNGKGWQDVTKQDVIDYMMYLRSETKLKNESINTYLKSLKRFYGMACERNYLRYNPVDDIDYFKEKSPTIEHKFISEDGLSLLSDIAINDIATEDKRKTRNLEMRYRDYAIVSFLALTGLRAGELCNLKFENIKYYDNAIELEFTGKGNKQRNVQIDQDILKPIFEYRKMAGLPVNDEEYLFYTVPNNRYKERKPLNRHSLLSIIKRLGKKAGFKNVYTHMLRHSYITHIIKSGCPLHRAKDQAGHADISTTMVYTHDNEPVTPYLASIKRSVKIA